MTKAEIIAATEAAKIIEALEAFRNADPATQQAAIAFLEQRMARREGRNAKDAEP
jgi:hypothetical protein